jgi:DNA polymerase I-like protein with 3'-5' exonuclease and polymerase domains
MQAGVLFVRKRRTRPPPPEDVKEWLKQIPLWERNASYPSADFSNTTASQQQQRQRRGHASANVPQAKPSPPRLDANNTVAARDEDAVEVVSEARRRRTSSLEATPSKAQQRQSSVFGYGTRAPQPQPQTRKTFDQRAISAQEKKRKKNAKAREGGGVEVVSLGDVDGSDNRRRSSSLFNLSDLLPSTNAVALPSYVVDLSEKENLTLFKSLLEAGTSGDITFTLLLSCRSYGKKRPTAKWRNASQYCTSSTPLCKEQLKVLKIKTGSDFTKMDPDGLVLGMCFMATEAADAMANAKKVYFLPLCPKPDCLISVSEDVSLLERIQFVEEFLRSKHVVQCFDLQGVLRRLYDTGVRQGIMNSKSRFICLKILSWMLEPGLLHDKVIDAYSLRSVASLYRIHIQMAEGANEADTDSNPFSGVRRDLELTHQLGKKLGNALQNVEFSHLLQVEVQVADLLAQMEAEGVHYNLSLNKGYERQIKEYLSSIEKEAFAIAGETFNMRSPLQLANILYTRLGAPELSSSRASRNQNSRSTDEQTLQSLAKFEKAGRIYKICTLVLEHRRFSQIVSKWIEADWLERAKLCLPERENSTGLLKIRCNWNQVATATGRLSASNPNLQAVTKYTIRSNSSCSVSQHSNVDMDMNVHINIRDAFVAGNGKRFLSMDYSQIEIRLLAHLSGDRELCKILNESDADKSDLFTKLAKTWLMNVPVKSKTGSARDQAKRVSYSIIYGTSAMALGKQLEIDMASAQRLKTSFLSFFSGVKAFNDEIKAFAKTNGYVETILKRRRFLPDILSQDANERKAAERKAVNTVVQGSAADLTSAPWSGGRS